MGGEREQFTVAEFIDILVESDLNVRTCAGRRLAPHGDTVRVDPLGERTGIFVLLFGQTGKSLSMSAVHPQSGVFQLTFVELCAYMRGLIEPQDTSTALYVSGLATLNVSPGCLVVAAVSGYIILRDKLRAKVEKRKEKNINGDKTV